jgi:predicted transcriptional regulator
MAKKQISFRLDDVSCEQLAGLAKATDQSQADILEQAIALAAELQDIIGQPDEQQRTAYACERYAGQLKARCMRYAAQ